MAASGAARRRHEVVLVDLTGDVAVAVGVSSDLPGVADWVSAGELSLGAATALQIDLNDRVRLLPRGSGELDPERLATLWSLLSGKPQVAIVDAGRGLEAVALVDDDNVRRLLVVSTCYYAVYRAVRLIGRVDDMIVMADSMRSLTVADVECGVGHGASASLPVDPAIARWADAGLLLDRSARLSKPLDQLL
ncbi:MAG TPA: hypothetical protein DEP66_06210 [Acidimicrobiaceae bacterium]|nr:hypothetical protein [Acidimicrobiaceae bacterium]HCB37783.1 hypothetical protein [Acidimicrobiaceae bacterium]